MFKKVSWIVLFIFVTILFSGCVPAEVNSASIPLVTTLDDGLKDLIQAIKDVAPSVWDIYVQRAYAQGIAYTVWSIIALVGIVTSYLTAKKSIVFFFKHSDDKDISGETFGWMSFFAVMSIITFIISFIVFFSNINNAVLILGAPEYYAIQLLLSTLK